MGDFTGVGQLNPLLGPRTQGGRFRYNLPDKWEVVNARFNQAGLVTVSMELTFYWSEEAHRISMGNTIDTPGPIDDAPSNNEYTVLLLTSDENDRPSILIPRCSSRRGLSNDFLKTNATDVPVVFYRAERNKQIQVFRRGTYSELAAILGARSPI